MAGRIATRLNELGITLPKLGAPIANYVPYRVTGHLAHISGHGPVGADGRYVTGMVGAGVSPEQATATARIVGLQLLSALSDACSGDLDRVRRCVRLFGLIYCRPDFTAVPAVMNGASDLMVAVFGEAGRHARTTIGARALPMGISVEIDAIFEIA